MANYRDFACTRTRENHTLCRGENKTNQTKKGKKKTLQVACSVYNRHASRMRRVHAPSGTPPSLSLSLFNRITKTTPVCERHGALGKVRDVMEAPCLWRLPHTVSLLDKSRTQCSEEQTGGGGSPNTAVGTLYMTHGLTGTSPGLCVCLW